MKVVGRAVSVLNYNRPFCEPKKDENINKAVDSLIDYEKMAKTMAPIVADALERADIKAKIGQQEVWKSSNDT
ncbi:hypothetical protein BN3590_02863 [Clostridium sp. C105KSO15]|nr:hypothetical protein BN3590_02863 [Clostridium sp. C105KSO15]